MIVFIFNWYTIDFFYEKDRILFYVKNNFYTSLFSQFKLFWLLVQFLKFSIQSQNYRSPVFLFPPLSFLFVLRGKKGKTWIFIKWRMKRLKNLIKYYFIKFFIFHSLTLFGSIFICLFNASAFFISVYFFNCFITSMNKMLVLDRNYPSFFQYY